MDLREMGRADGAGEEWMEVRLRLGMYCMGE